jgi:hypothetical protein
VESTLELVLAWVFAYRTFWLDAAADRDGQQVAEIMRMAQGGGGS